MKSRSIKTSKLVRLFALVSLGLGSVFMTSSCKSSENADTNISAKPVSILILCTGNSCRSQMAHGFMESFDSSLDVHSGGVAPAKQVNPKAVQAMKEIGIDIANHKPMGMSNYLDKDWDFVVTVCNNADETCPNFNGKVGKRIHMPFDDPSHAKGTDEFIWSEYIRVRGEIKEKFFKLYKDEIIPLKAARVIKK